jgi:glycosyltransferase involved in cell wall biosynthesis
MVGSHHLAREMAMAGHNVWHIEPPVTLAHIFVPGNDAYRMRVAHSVGVFSPIQDRLISITPFTAMPWQIARQFLRYGNPFLLFSNIAGVIRKAAGFGSPDVLFVDDPRFVGLEKILNPKSLFYRPTDLYSEMKSDSTLITAERQILSRSDGVVATSRSVLLHALTLKPGLPSLLLENGVEYSHFAQSREEPDELKSIPHPRAVYVGAVDSRFDFEALIYMADHFPDVHFVIIGPGDQLDKLRALQSQNVHVLGPKPYRVIPEFLRHTDVGILPIRLSATNLGRSPMKLYEYGAAGLPVVAGYTPELSRRKESFVHLYKTYDEAVDILRRVLENPVKREAIAEKCQKHTWSEKAARLLDFVKAESARRSFERPGRQASSPAITINGRFLDQEMTGVQRYSHGMLAGLGNKLLIARPASRLSPAGGHLWEQFVLPFRCKRSLLWSPGNTGPWLKKNQVVTIHDVSTLDHPEWFSGKFALWYRFLLPRLARRVRKIITVSEFSKARLVTTCSIPPEKVEVVHNAVDTRFKPASGEAIGAWRRRHQIERPYCLYVGSLEPRKNLRVLLEAWAMLAPRDCDLLIAGAPGRVFREKGFTDLPANTRLFGRVADDELPVLLSGARCFVFPSLYEGFGYPPLEAMACGCPVICSDATSLPEACGPPFDPADEASTGAVLYFDPTKPDQLVSRLRTVMALQPEIAHRLSRNGILWAGRFHRDRCASETWAILNELISS